MNERTLTALKESIEHWERLASGETGFVEDVGSADCALCTIFLDEHECAGCPVHEKTGAEKCAFSPYVEALNSRRKYGLDSPQFKSAARKELKFLKSLLPKPTKKKGQTK